MATTQLDKTINIDGKEYSITAVKADEAAKLTNGLKINIGAESFSFDGSEHKEINIFSGNYNDLTDKPTIPTIPTVNNGTLTIQRNSATVQTFTANQSSSVVANITVPTKVSELTNDSGFKTTDNNTTYDLAAAKSKANGNVTIDLIAGGSGSGTDSVQIKGSGTTTVTTDANGVITISSTGGGTGNGDMLKSVYVTGQATNTNKVDKAINAEQLGGVAASNYAKKSDIHNITVSQEEPTGGATGDIWFKY